jgi:hypothetical protein
MIGGSVHGGRAVLQVRLARKRRLRGRGTQRGTEAIPLDPPGPAHGTFRSAQVLRCQGQIGFIILTVL